ncbi:MAG TPA: hypothetical protein VJW95_02930 [Dissulfurispiraceae bacterium]|nr:hypothetical protein [Dissulfurispiraceae bacterium]
MSYYLVIASVFVLLIAAKLARFIGTLVVLALIVIAVTLKKRR